MHDIAEPPVRHRLDVRGQIQGVGFRPFVYRLAAELGLSGYVANNSNGAVIEIEGPGGRVTLFEESLVQRLPPLARIVELVRQEREPTCGDGGRPCPPAVRFEIRESEQETGRTPEVTPDAALCTDCLSELFDPADRRYRYAFINCTNCGPRYSIITGVPYDRPATTMSEFTMCPACAAEYSEPSNRRFHAQPNACPVCGPRLSLCRPDGSIIPGDPIETAAELLRNGQIVAVKGIGGYHLACRADREDAVWKMRERKIRDGKPLAVMVADLQAARRVCALTAAAEEMLALPAAPIVLARKALDHGLAESVAPGCPDFGVMLPYAPVHHLLFHEGLGPLVMTSGNLAGRPLTFLDEDALADLADIADALLMHNRRISRPIDDSVAILFRGRSTPLRRARGFAPTPIRLAHRAAAPILAVGAELKSTVCLYAGRDATLSEHLGDLTQPRTYRHFVDAVERLSELMHFHPAVVAHDLHPQYLSTRYARERGLPLIGVQHHHAHVVSVMAEWGVDEPVVGVCCDGVGYGTDGAMWGCEVLACDANGFERLGHLEYFPLIGGDAAAVETWRPAAALLRQAFGRNWRGVPGDPFRAIAPEQLAQAEQIMAAGVNMPRTSSLGRVFDGVSFLLGLCTRNRHEAEAAMALEAAADDVAAEAYPYQTVARGQSVEMSLGPTMTAMMRDLYAGRSTAEIAARFHETVACMLSTSAVLACEARGLRTVAISGGCFANRRLLGRLVERLERRHLRVLFHRRVPCGDGGLSLGQAVIAAAGGAGVEIAAED